jgi:hypothetical protein
VVGRVRSLGRHNSRHVSVQDAEQDPKDQQGNGVRDGDEAVEASNRRTENEGNEEEDASRRRVRGKEGVRSPMPRRSVRRICGVVHFWRRHHGVRKEPKHSEHRTECWTIISCPTRTFDYWLTGPFYYPTS